MKHKQEAILKHTFLLALILGLICFDFVYYYMFHNALPFHFQIAGKLLLFAVWLFWFHRWYMTPYLRIVKSIRRYYMDVAVASLTESERLPYTTLEKIIHHYQQHRQMQDELLKKLKHKNELLEQNSKITNSIMEITKDILFSGEIDKVLQNILDKAIEIIPNAQKGSILIYNGTALKYKAVSGYDFEVLRDFTFDITESYQYIANDFLEPIIIQDIESFNRNLNKVKYETLKNSKSFELKSVISCAISSEGEFLGIINIDNAEDTNAFSDADKPIIKHLSEQMGLALKNAKLMEKTLFLSRHDGLTGIYNRCYFEELYDEMFISAADSCGSFSLVLFDINDLKLVNDSYGHEAGDMLIKKFVNIILEGNDKPDIFARTGGDEFVAVFINKGSEEVYGIVEDLKSYFELSPLVYKGKNLLYITFGYGVSSFPEDSTIKDDLIGIADRKMYLNKNNSKCKLNANN